MSATTTKTVTLVLSLLSCPIWGMDYSKEDPITTETENVPPLHLSLNPPGSELLKNYNEVKAFINDLRNNKFTQTQKKKGSQEKRESLNLNSKDNGKLCGFLMLLDGKKYPQVSSYIDLNNFCEKKIDSYKQKIQNIWAFSKSQDFFENSLQITETVYNTLLQTQGTNQYGENLRKLFDASYGRDDCQEQAILLHTLVQHYVSKGLTFKELPVEVQKTLMLSFTFSEINKRDDFGMVIDTRDKNVVSVLDKYAYEKLRRSYARTTLENTRRLSKELELDWNSENFKEFIHPQNGLPQLSTTTGIWVMLEMAKKYQIPVGLKVKRMEVVGDNFSRSLKGQGETFLTYTHNQEGKLFPSLIRDPDQPMFCIRGFSIYNKAASNSYSGTYKDSVIKYLSEAKDFECFQKILQACHIKNLILSLAASDDLGKDREIKKGVLAPYFQANVLEHCSGNYVRTSREGLEYSFQEVPFSLCHVYVSTQRQQQDSLNPQFAKITAPWPSGKEDPQFEYKNPDTKVSS